VALEVIDDALDRLRSSDQPTLSDRIHEARKRFKEIRAILKIASHAAGIEGQAAGLLFRDAGRQLAASRDADALIEAFDEMRLRFGPAWRTRRFGKIRRQLERLGQAATAQHTDDLQSRIATVRPQFASWALLPSSFELLEGGLRRGYRQARKGMRNALSARQSAAFHEWRKRVKDHWYQSKVIENVWPAAMTAQNSSLHELSRILGRHHDLAMLSELINGQPQSFGSQRYVRSFRKFIDLRMQELENDARSLGEKLFSDDPDVWIGRMRDYWNSSELSGPVHGGELPG
jgi:CHAD domain-containing protein